MMWVICMVQEGHDAGIGDKEGHTHMHVRSVSIGFSVVLTLWFHSIRCFNSFERRCGPQKKRKRHLDLVCTTTYANF